ncbi:MAG: hypothetical protein Q9218_003241 [Villophora microphyllina]
MAQDGNLPSTAATVSCLVAAFSETDDVDFSVFSTSTASCIVEAAVKILKDGNVKSLDLSHLRQLSETDLTKILGAATGLRTLYLLEMPQISVDFIGSGQSKPDAHFLEIYHTELFARPLANHSNYVYSQLMADLGSPPFTFGERSPAKQLLLVRISEGGDVVHPCKNDGIAIDWQQFEPWDHLSQYFEANKMAQYVYPLQDTFIHPMRLVTGLTNLVNLQSHKTFTDMYDSYDDGFRVAQSFSMTSSKSGGPCTKVTPLPETLFKTCIMATRATSPYWPVPFAQLKAGEWSIIMVHEQFRDSRGAIDSHTFRVAVVTAIGENGKDRFRIESVGGFLENVMAQGEGADADAIATAVEYWGDKISAVDSCTTDEVHDLLPVFERNINRMRDGRGFATLKRFCWEEQH